MVELTWEGKYVDGKKAAPVRIALPFQTVETVNESAADRSRNLELFRSGHEREWRNRLIWGDKKYVLPSLLPEFAGKVDLIYIDPPFDTGADFSYIAQIPETGDKFEKAPSLLEQKAYRDTWRAYHIWLYETLMFLNELLGEEGLIFLHLGWQTSHIGRLLLDEIMGRTRFVNEMIWKRQSAHSDATQGAEHLGRIHDTVLIYSKGEDYCWHQLYTEYDQETVNNFYNHVEQETGRRYSLGDITAPGGAAAKKGNPRYEFLGVTRYWRFSKAKMEEMYKAGRIVQTKPGNVPLQKRYLDEMPGVPLQDLWLDIRPLMGTSREGVGYPTQKPEKLLERVIDLASSEGDLVLDCFCGSGTTPAVAEKLGRRWIACDLGRFAIHTTRKRLLGIPNVRPFEVQNLGKYERQAWQVAEFEDPSARADKEEKYRHFILELYQARPVKGHTWLHGIKAGRMVHVGAVDAPVTLEDVKAVCAEIWRAVGKGKESPQKSAVDILGWDFAFEVNETARQMGAEANVDVKLKQIPREVLDKRAVEQGDVKFFELAALSVEHRLKQRTITMKLTDFVIPPDDVPEDVQKAITHWEQWVDYWAVDWDYRGDAFHNQWQSYRSRQDPNLQLQITHKYEEAGKYTVVVKVIDILGNDTTKAISVEVQ